MGDLTTTKKDANNISIKEDIMVSNITNYNKTDVLNEIARLQNILLEFNK